MFPGVSVARPVRAISTGPRETRIRQRRRRFSKRRFFLTAAVLVAFGSNAHADETIHGTTGVVGTVPGLIATFWDDVRSVSETVAVPELGLAAEESPHPAIKPSFTASFEGFLEITQAGLYHFETNGTLSIDDELVTDERTLKVGLHAIRLTYQRQPGELRFGLSWESEYFVDEPVPPTVFWHAKDNSVVVDHSGTFPSPPHRIRKALTDMNCVSCHDSGFLATMHHKFNPDSLLTLIRHANASKWYGAMTGPLLPESETLTELAADLRKLPRGRRVRGESRSNPNRAKNMVGNKTGFACIACHGIKHHLTEAETKGPNLSLIADRVSYDWFVRWMENPGRLKPGVPMPAFFAGQKPAERQENIDALWDYLSLGERMDLPDELTVDLDQFVLKPTDRPLYTRTYMRLPNGRELLRAICVGLPNGVSYSFDAETCQLAYVWTGGFLDMAPHWQNQSGHPTPAIGETFHLASSEEGLRIGNHKPRFRGYELVDGVPRFEFTVGDTAVHLLIDVPSAERLRQTFRIGERSAPINFLRPSPESGIVVSASSGTWRENQLTITDVGDVEFTVIIEREK